MTVMVHVYDKDKTLHVSINTHLTGHPNSMHDLHQRLANRIEASVYETVRQLITNAEIPEAVIIWDNQTIRIRHAQSQ